MLLHLMRHKGLFFILSSLVILPGLFYLITGNLKFGIDFTGGLLLEYKLEEVVSTDQLRTTITGLGIDVGAITDSGNNTYIIRTKPVEIDKLNELKRVITESSKFEIRREESVGPIIGAELKQKAIIGTILACVMIVLYITYSFRKVPKPASSFRFGVAAVVALIHDVLVLVGSFAIFGKFFGVEVDTLSVTAVLTVIGFSVHDTIVVFDRIRENMPKHLGMKFSDVADLSIVQTLARSLNTSLTVLIVLLALLLFGGGSIYWFVMALLIGIISGTYSSIFNATALLCWWEEKLGH